MDTSEALQYMGRLLLDNAQMMGQLEAENARLRAALEQAESAMKMVREDKAPAYHDCMDDGLDKCAWCFIKDAIQVARAALGKE